jgi:isoquinoline 1-oxidoreductase beta subunit
VFGAKVAKFDASKAKAIRGVIEVLEIPVDRGGRGVAVIADGYWPAKQGRDALDIEWDTDGVGKVDQPPSWPSSPSCRRPRAPSRAGRYLEAGRRAKKISAVYEFPYLAHAPMEPINCTVDLKDDSCTLWVGSQFQTGDQAAAAPPPA